MTKIPRITTCQKRWNATRSDIGASSVEDQLGDNVSRRAATGAELVERFLRLVVESEAQTVTARAGALDRSASLRLGRCCVLVGLQAPPRVMVGREERRHNAGTSARNTGSGIGVRECFMVRSAGYVGK
jgi:hypothetical protein